MAQILKVSIIVISSCVVMSNCEESSQELKIGKEYIQIFRSIPKLFEYLLDVLEKRPEILEDNQKPAFEELAITDNGEKSETKGPRTSNVEKNYEDNTIERHEYGNSIKVTKGKRSVNENSNSYSGTMDWVFSLSAEEVEELAVKVEKEIEEYNQNK